MWNVFQEKDIFFLEKKVEKNLNDKVDEGFTKM